MLCVRWILALTGVGFLAGCGLSTEPTRVLAQYSQNKAEFNALVSATDACRPVNQPTDRSDTRTWIMPDPKVSKLVCMRSGQDAETIRPMMRKLRIRSLSFEDDNGSLIVSLTMETAGIAVSGSERNLVFYANGNPIDPGQDGEIRPADANDRRWYVETTWT